MGFVVELIVFFCSGAALTAQCLLLASCKIMNLNGVFRTGGYGLFFIDVPDLQQEKCIKTEEIDAIFGPWGDDFSWEPREDNFLATAQVGSTLALAFGFVSLATWLCRQCCFPLPCSQFLTDVSGVAIQAGLGMVYLMWASDGCEFYQCEYGEGASFLIAAQVLWLVASCLSRCMRPSAAERKKTESE